MTNIKKYLRQIITLLDRVETITRESNIYDYLRSLPQGERNDLWEMCNTLDSFSTTQPFTLLQQQIETVEKEDEVNDFSLNGFPSGAEVVKGEVIILHAINNINKLSK